MKQCIFSRLYTRFGEFGGGPAYPNPTFTGLRGRRLMVQGETTQNYIHPWSVDGSFKMAYVRLDNSGDGHGGVIPPLGFSKDVTYTTVINGVDSALQVSLLTGQTAASDAVHSAPVLAGQTFLTRVNAAGAGGTFGELNQFDTHLAYVFESSAPGMSGYVRSSFGSTLGPSAGAYYSSPFGHHSVVFDLSAGPNPQDPELYNYVAVPGTLLRIDMLFDFAPGVGTSWDFVVIKNGVVQDGSGGTVDTRFSVSGTNTSGFGTFSLHFNSGDWMTLRALKNGAAATVQPSYSCAFLADVDGQYNFVCSNTSPSLTVPSHMGSTYWSGWDTVSYPDVLTEADLAVDTGLLAFQVAGFIVWLSTSPDHLNPGGQFVWNARQNLANADALQLAMTALTVDQVNTAPFVYPLHSLFSFMGTPSGPPNGPHMAFAFLLEEAVAPPSDIVRLTQLPLEAAYPYSVLQPNLNTAGLRWATPPPEIE